MVFQQFGDLYISGRFRRSFAATGWFWTIRRLLHISGRFRRCNAQFLDVLLTSQGLTRPTMISHCVLVRIEVKGEHGTLRVAWRCLMAYLVLDPLPEPPIKVHWQVLSGVVYFVWEALACKHILGDLGKENWMPELNNLLSQHHLDCMGMSENWSRHVRGKVQSKTLQCCIHLKLLRSWGIFLVRIFIFPVDGRPWAPWAPLFLG